MFYVKKVNFINEMIIYVKIVERFWIVLLYYVCEILKLWFDIYKFF